MAIPIIQGHGYNSQHHRNNPRSPTVRSFNAAGALAYDRHCKQKIQQQMTREEAINKIRQMRLPKETMEILKALAPELRESEDERIWEALYDFISDTLEDYLSDYGISKGEALAYLEKQKEQKPAEWNKEDKEMFEEVNESLYCYESGKAPEVVAQIEAERRWFYSLPERFNLQPKQEWSEEEKEILDSIFSHYVLIDKPTDANGISKEKYISLIKSLRFDTYKNCNSHWKPSEEQMDALHQCVVYLHGEGSLYFEPIKSLYEQLKKL